MANAEHLAMLGQGVEAWNQWRRENPEVQPDLSEANLQGANLQGIILSEAYLIYANFSGANFSGANFSGADLEGTDLTQADLEGAILSYAIFSEAILTDADLEGADLTQADFSDANLSRANFTRADLTQADLSDATLSEATFTKAVFGYTHVTAVDLRGVRGLNTVEHVGPSSIGLDTIERSHGQIPESFLRGCGVSDRLIEYLSFLTTQPIQYYSLFISYSSTDEALAKCLHADLQAAGVRCWFAPHDMQIGDSIIDRIDQAIRLHEKLLLILSESSVTSEWVGTEVKTALMRERNERRGVLFPIRIDEAIMQSVAGWAGQVQARHIGDFRQWKEHDAYQVALTRLLRDLRSGSANG